MTSAEDTLELAKLIKAVSLVTGRFRLRSGAISTEYFDKYRFESDPALLSTLAGKLAELVPQDTNILAGLELGGVPLATALSLRTGIPAVFVRKTAKEYGTCRLAEGRDIRGRNLLVVEDVITSGGRAIESALNLRALGARVQHAVCVIDREQGGSAALAEIGIELHSLLTRSVLETV